MARLSAPSLARAARFLRLAGVLALLTAVAAIGLALAGESVAAAKALRVSIEVGGAVLILAALFYMYAMRRGARQDDL